MSKRVKTTRTRASRSRPNNSLAPTSTFATKILTNDLIFDLVFCSVSPGTLLRFRRASKQAKAAVESYFTRAFNINKHLSQFFENPQEFRSLQARTATLISGSNALQFFNRLVYPDSDLDLYAYNVHGLEVGHWLLERGYFFQPNTKQHELFDVAYKQSKFKNDAQNADMAYNLRGVTGIFTFVKESHKDPSKELKVQIVAATNTPMEVILCFHSTAVLNVIAWDTAYSMYPRATFETRDSLSMRTLLLPDPGVEKKYRSRGWELYYRLSHLQHDRAFEVARWIGDSHSWVIKLDHDGVALPPPISKASLPLSRDPCYATSWTIQHGDTFNPPSPSIFVQKHPSLFYGFVVQYPLWPSVVKDIKISSLKRWTTSGEYFDQQLLQYFEKNVEKKRAWHTWPGPESPEDSDSEEDSELDDPYVGHGM